MTPEQVAEFLKGKTVKEIKHYKYMFWDMCVSEIIFTDGTVVYVGGNDDCGRFDDIIMPDGRYEDIYDEGMVEL